jgi:epoxyqueuosine reductase
MRPKAIRWRSPRNLGRRVSVYAQGGDYHKTVKKRLKALARWLVENAGGELKVFVDTAPVMEKPLAEASRHRLAGQAYQPRQPRARQLAVPRHHPHQPRLEPDEPARDTCGSCTRCLDACPTQAFDGPGGSMPASASPISPSSIRARSRTSSGGDRQPDLRLRRLPRGVPVEPIRRGGGGQPRLPSARGAEGAEARRPARARRYGFRAMFAGSPIKRIGVKRMIRNCLIAAGNSRDPEAVPAVRPHLADPRPGHCRSRALGAGRASGPSSERMQSA